MLAPYNFYQMSGLMMLCLFFLILWTLIIKGLGLWFSARNNQRGWFIAMLILNTMGILPLVYLIFFRKNCHKCTEIKPLSKEAKVNSKIVSKNNQKKSSKRRKKK